MGHGNVNKYGFAMSPVLINESVGELHCDNCTPSLPKGVRRLAIPDSNYASKVDETLTR